jgi:hypothetical protein
MVTFSEGGFNQKEYADIMNELFGEQDPNEINLVEGVDDDAIILEKKPPEEEKP